MVKAAYNKHQPQVGEAHTYDLSMAQDRVSDFISNLYTVCPMLDGALLEDVSIAAFVANDIQHKLGRDARGWFPVLKKQSPCSAQAYLSSAYNLPNNAWTTLPLDGESHDSGGIYNAATYTITIPITGKYNISGAMTITALDDGDPAGVRLKIVGSSTYYYYGNYTSPKNAYQATRTISTNAIRLTEGDLVTLEGFQVTGGVEALTTGAGHSYLMINQVDELSDDQDNSPDKSKYLRLYSSIDRAIDLWVF